MEARYGQLLVNKQICTGCRSCEVVCSFLHEGCFWPEKSRVQVYKNEADGLDYPVVCRQCDEPSCLEACPSNALERDSKTGAVLVGKDCVGCGDCIDACPYQAVSFDKERERPLICDLCGGQPACVQRCVVHALKYINVEGKVITAQVHAITLPQDKLL